jgi:hypothetical protein
MQLVLGHEALDLKAKIEGCKIVYDREKTINQSLDNEYEN